MAYHDQVVIPGIERETSKRRHLLFQLSSGPCHRLALVIEG